MVKLHKIEVRSINIILLLQTENNLLRDTVKRLDAKILELREQEVPVPSDNRYFYNIMIFISDKYKEIIIHTIESLENITRSPLTNRLMNNPVLTPSLTLVDRDDIYKILDKNPGHKFLKLNKPVKGKLFMPFKGIVNFRVELKKMYEKVLNEQSATSSASNTEVSKKQTRVSSY